CVFASFFGQKLFAPLNNFITALFREPVSNPITGSTGPDESKPILRRARAFILIGEDFHRVAVVEHCVQRYEATIHSGTHSSVSNLGVHTISKIDRGRTRGQR